MQPPPDFSGRGLRLLRPGDVFTVPAILGLLTWFTLRATTPESNRGSRPLSSQSELDERARLGYLLEVVADRLPFTCNCLPRALAISRLLGSTEHTVHLGARKDGDSLAAHAWVSIAGHIIVGGAVAADYSEFDARDGINERSTTRSPSTTRNT